MYEQDKSMQYAFYAGVIVFFVFAVCYFSTSHVDTTGSERVGDGISNSQNLNSELQKSVDDSQTKVRGTIERLGSAEKELDRAERSIERCEQIIRTAQSRTQETNTQTK